MKYIITEEQNARLFVKRRLPEIMKYVRSTSIYRDPCRVAHISHYPLILKQEFFETVPFDFYVNMNMISDKEFVWDLIMSQHLDEIMDNYNQKCRVQ
jgi:hypothetical protein